MESKQYTSKELLHRFVPYLMKYRKTLCMDLFCAALTTVCELVLPLIMRYITNEGLRDLAALSMKTVGGLGILYLILRIVDCIAGYYMADMGHVMGAKIETDMRRDAYEHLQRLSNTYYNNTKVGQIMGRISNDLFDVTEFAHHCPEEFFIAGIKTLISFFILAGVNLWLTLLIFLCVPLMTVVCMALNFRMRAAFRKQRHQIGELNARIEDSLLGHKVVKAFANEEIETEKFERDNQAFFDIKKESYRYMAQFQTTVKLFDGLMYLTVVVAGGFFMIKGLIAPGDLVAYMLYVTTLIATIRRIIEFAEQFQRGMTGIERFLEILDADIEIFDEPGAVELKNPKGNIIFENVGFTYQDDHNRVFEGLNLQIRAGEKVAIVGPSGGGKTTLCNLIPRFYDVTQGRILLDGRNIKEFTLKSLRGNIGIVQQDVYLFSGTVYENIAYGKPEASEAEVEEAAKRAGAHDFIMELKDGYHTYVGERGVKLSGGQKQRISIARVFLKNPPIIILDEATSALDNESEFAVANSLAKLSEGRTTLTIAHRLSSIKNSDRILVLTEEGIVEEGSHRQLLEKKGIYCHFYEMADRLK
ncbi:MAG: ABC transporter ATP-binding protein/permease [Bacteroidales bacterium]|nr:ABC transporter ATP-binding protein/permease [Lachnoclostridium sp.]MCM1385212.1 ABC transporter ATP-binding protein/permease [Lachnoclostridium sp.]MCM1466103.1 ABC transporter ATP-binding protein/permease [Bacteroidales bacterium]